MKGKVTMSMIAEMCDTSIGTVDRALNGRIGINEETRRRILEAAREVGYRPNKYAGALSRKREKRIGIVYFHETAEYYSIVAKGINRAAKELSGLGIRVEHLQSRSMSQALQAELLSSLTPSRYDALVINSAGSGIDAYIDRFSEQGIPVATFDTDAPNSKRLFYVGANASDMGRLGAEFIGKMLRSQGRVAVLGNFLTGNAYVERFVGFCEVMQKDYPSIQLLPVLEQCTTAEEARQKLIELLQSNPNIDALFPTNYTCTVGTIQALQELNRPDILLVGFDLCPASKAALEEGWCTAVVFQDPFQQGYRAVKLMAQHLLDGWLPARPLLYISPQIIMNYNSKYQSDLELLEEML